MEGPCLWIRQQARGMQEAWPAPRQNLISLKGVQGGGHNSMCLSIPV